MCVPCLSSFLQDSIQFERGILVDVDVGEVTFLSNGEMLSARVHRDRTHAIAILAMECRILLRLQVVSLILVTTDKDDGCRGQEVDIVTLHGRQTQNSVECEVTLGDYSIRQGLGHVTVGVKFVDSFLICLSGSLFHRLPLTW